MADTGEQSVTSFWIGLDVGSTTVKIAVVDPRTRSLVHSRCERHNSNQAEVVADLLGEVHARLPEVRMQVAVCGSGGQPFAVALGAFFVQEVIANTIAIKEHFPTVRTAIELGGQDAKVIFFTRDPVSGALIASDMRMNGSCAGGTGAFIDQVAGLLSVPIERFEALASAGKTVHDISGRCGVFAKTDIQPLLNQGAAREDIALSALHAITKQTIGGLAQGMEIRAPVIFEGGPNLHIPTLVDVFCERLGLDDGDAIIPADAQTLVAQGAALAIGELFAEQPCGYRGQAALADLHVARAAGRRTQQESTPPFFSGEGDRRDFLARHAHPSPPPRSHPPGARVDAWLGIDVGSTTSKLVLLDDDEQIIDTFYAANHGEPLLVVRDALLAMVRRYSEAGVELRIRGAGTTGYGEMLFASAFHADFHTVETVAHAEAARRIDPEVSFVLDIGGQDMKAIRIQRGIVTGITLNEACSAGCGSFLETYAGSLGIPVDDISGMAFAANNPSQLGSRCTVFMNSSIITEQRDGRTSGDIMAGLCRSIVENVFTKVIRMNNLEAMGSHVVAQGGTFKNDAVLRAFEQYIGRSVVRPPMPGEMGAIGIALLTREHMLRVGVQESSFLSWDALEAFEVHCAHTEKCPFCTNNCARSVVRFGHGTSFVTGNRCERGEVLGDPRQKATRERVKAIKARMDGVPNMLELHDALLHKRYAGERLVARRGLKIGIPRTLEMWHSLPFWRALHETLGFDVVVSRRSDQALFDSGLPQVPSDTACLPAKLVHGHVADLVARGVDRIFLPMMVAQPTENASCLGTAFCPLVQGYPIVVAICDDPERRHGIPLVRPIFHWHTEALKERQVVAHLADEWGVPRPLARRAFALATEAWQAHKAALRRAGEEIVAEVTRSGTFAVVVAARPYHSDAFVNHGLGALFTRAGVPVITLDGLPLENEDLLRTRMDANNSFHARVLAAAQHVAGHLHLELCEIVSFGCGHEAILTDEMLRILGELSDKEALVVKLDEGECRGPLSIRVRSFLETIRARRRERGLNARAEAPPAPFRVRFEEHDRDRRTVLVPNLSPAFSMLVSAMFEREGYLARTLPLADAGAIALGKRYVHNDICFPAQLNIGEALAELRSSGARRDEVAVGIAKNCEHCRAGHYATLARKALDEAGYDDVPLITTGTDDKDMHPGFVLGRRFRMNMVQGLAVIDAIERMIRATRPYAPDPARADEVHNIWLRRTVVGLREGRREGLAELRRAVEAFNAIPIDRSRRRPRVGVLGEILVKYHPVANCGVERYLEGAGMEIVQPPILDFFRMSEVIDREKARRGWTMRPFLDGLVAGFADGVYGRAASRVDRIMRRWKLYDPLPSTAELAALTAPFIDITYGAGEAWLIPAEILDLARKGVRSFVVVQPFGCIPNHITGRGVVRKLKELQSGIQVLSLDYDPDTSLANVESRLQMLIMNAARSEQLSAAYRTQEGAATACRRGADTSLESPFDVLEPADERAVPVLEYQVPGRAVVVPVRDQDGS